MGEGIGGLSMGIKVAIAAAVIVLVAVGVGAKVSQNKQKNDAGGSAISPTTPGTAADKSTTNNTSPYSDDSYGGTFSGSNPNFIFHYPSNWLLSKDNEQYVFRSSADGPVLVTMTYQTNTDKKATDVFASSANKGSKTEKVSLEGSTLTAYKVGVSNKTNYYVGNDQAVFTFILNSSDAKVSSQLVKSMASLKF